MNKFWEWMDKEKGIEKLDNEHNQHGMIVSQHQFDEAYVERFKPMLIGYMIEYCIENELKVDIEIPEDFTLTIDKIYNNLESKIEVVK